MRTVGAFEAKTHLAQLLDEVAQGEIIEITRHGVPVAHLTPPMRESPASLDAIVAQIRELRDTVVPLSQQEIRALREEGRRF